MTAAELVPGDLVRLRSGGPDMTVGEIVDGNITCFWFDSRQEVLPRYDLTTVYGLPMVCVFPPAALEHVR